MMKVTPHFSIGLLTAALLIPACGDAPSGTPASLSQRAGETTSALVAGADADAIFLQSGELGQRSARTDAGSLNAPQDVAVGDGNVWVADTGNHRVLGYRNSASITTGQDADIVLLQSDMFATDAARVPSAQQLSVAADTPTLVELDDDGRLYVSDSSRVVVYNNPFGTDTLIDYELNSLPATVTALRPSLTGERMIVVGYDAINQGIVQYYALGQSAPLAQGTINSATGPAIAACQATDAFETPNAVLVACENAAVACPAVVPGTESCHGVLAFERDMNTGVPIEPIVGFNMYTLRDPFAITPAQGLGRLRFAEVSNQLVILQQNQNRGLRFAGADALATGLFNATIVVPEDEQDSELATIYGQESIDEILANSPMGEPSATGLFGPSNVATDTATGDLWIADMGNNRVVRITSTAGDPPPIDRVLGQPNDTRTIANRLEANSALSVDDVAIDPVTGRTYVVDSAGHRVLVFDNLDTAAGDEDPIAVLGQATTFDVIPNDGGIDADRFNNPTHVAVDPTNGNLFVSDTGNLRILIFQNMRAATVPSAATKVIGADNFVSLTTDHTYNYQALTVRDNDLFVAAGVGVGAPHRVFYYDASASTIDFCPAAVFGQNEVPTATMCPRDPNNAVNRGTTPRADGFNTVTDVSYDSQGRLWVADSFNNRVLGFANATDIAAGGGSAALDRVEASIADIVVGQANFTDNGIATTDVAFSTPTSIAVDDAGILWVAMQNENRVLKFPRPTQKDPTAGRPRASLVLGQLDFTSTFGNGPPTGNGISAGTLNGPNALGLTDDGRTLVVADAGNNRVLRFLENRPPVISGGGTFTVVQGETISVPLTITDPEGDSTGAPTLAGPVPMGLTLNGNVVSYDSTGAAVGTVVRATVTVADQGPRSQTATASVIIQVVIKRTEPAAAPPAQTERPIVAPDSSCKCSGGAGNPMLWLLGAFVVVLRRRRR